MALQNKSVLIVDDMKLVRIKLSLICQNLGVGIVREAADGREALEALMSGHEFNLVLSDWNMPVMTGLELLRAVRENPLLERLPLILITSKDQQEGMVEAISHGATDYIVKPFSDSQVKQAILSVLEPTRS
jgi:CheY-like chemotaxis protein